MEDYEKALIKEKALYLALEYHEKKDAASDGPFKASPIEIEMTAKRFANFMVQ